MDNLGNHSYRHSLQARSRKPPQPQAPVSWDSSGRPGAGDSDRSGGVRLAGVRVAVIDRDASGISLAVNAKGEALISYTTGGKVGTSSRGAGSTRSRRHAVVRRSSSILTTPAAGASTTRIIGRRSGLSAAATTVRHSPGR